MSVVVPAAAGEEARARFLDLCPEGFEEREEGAFLELAAYVDEPGEERLRRALGAISSTPVADDWHERWRSFHHGVRVGPLWIGPPWEDPPPEADAVVVDPGQAFGTGAHPTTRLSLELLLRAPRGSLLDVGCGSGVFAIAAMRLGFAPVVAVDVDPAAIAATRSNASANVVAVDARLADVLADDLPATDVAVANVSLEVVEAVAGRLAATWLVTSGYLAFERPRADRYDHRERAERDGWAADLHELRRK